MNKETGVSDSRAARIELLEQRLRELEDIEAQTRRDTEIINALVNAINSSADAMIVYDMEGIARYVSDSFTQMFGWTRDEVIGKRIPFMPDSELEASLAQIRSLMKDGRPVSGFETVRQTKEGRTLNVSVSSSRYNDHKGNPAGILVIMRDISALKAMEQARERAVNHLSHELMTPLAIIDASINSLVKDDVPRQSKERAFERVQRNLKRLTDIQEVVQSIIAPPAYRPRGFSVVPHIIDILDLLRKRSSRRSVALIPVLNPVETEAIDPDILKRILETLVKNAVENSPDEGTVLVSIESTETGPLLKVEDRGVGISRTDQPFLFEAFHHTQDTHEYSTRRPFDFDAGGKGLELMQLKILADQGWFDIRIESDRCRYLESDAYTCPGKISSCKKIDTPEDCRQSGGTTALVQFIENRPM